MKKLFKIAAGMLAVVMLLSAMPLTVFAAEREGTVAMPKPFYSAADNSIYSSLGLTEQQLASLQKELTEAGKAWEESLDISAYGIDHTELNIALIANLFSQDCPELFHCWFSYSYIPGGDITGIIFLYDVGYTREAYDAIRAEYEAVAAEMTADLDGLTDLQKALLLHDRLAVHCEYDQVRLNAGQITSNFDPSYSMHGALAEGAAVCQGYAEAYSYLLELVGIDNYLCASQALFHVWNIVTIDGVKYHVDVTWDDPVWDKTGQVLHNNFLISTEALLATGHNANDFDNTPNDTRYDNAFWRNSQTEFQYIDGNFYYIDRAADPSGTYAVKGTLMRWDGAGAHTAELEVNDNWMTTGGRWSNNYARLSSWMGTLYYSLSSAIYSYNVHTKQTEKVLEPDMSGNDDNCIFGFAADDNTFYYEVYPTPAYDLGSKEAALRTHVFRTAEATVLGSSLTLGDTLDMNLMIEIPSAYDAADLKLAVTLDGETAYLPIDAANVDTIHTVVLPTAAKDMTATYTLQLVDENGNPLGAERITSVRYYAEALLTGGYADNVKAAAKAMLNYGAAAQAYFDTRTDTPANENYRMDLNSADVSGIADMVKENSLPSFIGCSLVLKSEVHVRVYFSEAVEGAVQNGYRYYLTVDGIGAGDLADTQTVSVGGATYRFSALSLAKAVIEGNYGEEFQDLMKALVLYANAVSAL
ncbi:MAG: hypothetical protein IIX68_02130 [Clostridia bacterium]|nr:hypothetical protein [Clostridia bacterium]